jgi:hypothetical protein
MSDPTESDEVLGPPAPRWRPSPAAIVALILLSATWAWWAWQDGGYFPVVLLPGTILLCAGAALLVGFAPWRMDLRRCRPILIAVIALVALAAWAALSALWSPAPDVAIDDGQRIAAYAIAFGLGIGLSNLLGRRLNLSLLPLAFAGAFAGVATIIVLHGGDAQSVLSEDGGTLDYPLGYRNANAAFFAIAMFAALGLAADRDLDWRVRGLALGTATLCIDFAALSQSRAFVPAMAVAVVIYLLAMPYRVRALSWLVLAALPAIAIVPALTDLFNAAADAGDRLPDLSNEMQHAAVNGTLSAFAAIALGALAARFDNRIPALGSHTGRHNRTFLWSMLGVAVIGAVAFVVAVGSPTQWASDRIDEFRHGGSPDLSNDSSRFVANLGSNRYDIWRVALDEFSAHPLGGDGGGGFQYAYLRERGTEEQNLRDAHSVELELLSELGIVGLGLFAVFIVGTIVAVMRARRLGPSAATLAAIALSATGYWLTHTSVDWFWPYPAVTAPVIALLGSACAPVLRRPERRAPGRGRGWRLGVPLALGLLAITTIPPFLSARYVNDAYAEWRSDLQRAYGDLDRAQSLNPLNEIPVLAEASIANAAGDRDRALAALREAEELRPEEWATHYLLAELHAHDDPAQAREQIRIALELNPLDPTIRTLADELGVRPPDARTAVG